ncbi:MAG TPA: hypothetical protein PK805_00260 [Acidovorax temperans]|nr:hypothetical protein [Acidovorax temperans]
MDIQCPTCGEPWETYHMRYDEPYEWGQARYLTKEFVDAGSRFSGPDDPMCKAAQASGWQFESNSILSFTSCPSCKGRSVLADSLVRKGFVAIAAEINGDDDDGLATALCVE